MSLVVKRLIHFSKLFAIMLFDMILCSGEKLASDFGLYITIRNFLSNQYLLSVSA